VTNPLLIQGIGLVALLLNLSVFQTNTRKIMLLLGLSACLLWTVHFYLLGAAAGAAMNLLAAGRFCVYYKIDPSKQNRWIMWLFIGLTTLAIAITWKGAVSLLPFAGTITGVIAFWQRSPKYIRLLALASPPPWFIYGAIVGSYPGMAAEALLLGSTFVGQYRFDFNLAFRRKLLRFNRSA
jgi:Bacterial inner membrane protein